MRERVRGGYREHEKHNRSLDSWRSWKPELSCLRRLSSSGMTGTTLQCNESAPSTPPSSLATTRSTETRASATASVTCMTRELRARTNIALAVLCTGEVVMVEERSLPHYTGREAFSAPVHLGDLTPARHDAAFQRGTPADDPFSQYSPH